MTKIPKAQPWAKRRAPSPSWTPTAKDLFKNIDVIHRAAKRAGIRPGDIDDVTADILGIAWRRLRTFKGNPSDPVGSFRGWLNAIAWRTARDRRIREQYEQAVAFQNYDQEGLLYPSPHARVVARFDLRRVGCLAPHYRRIAVSLAITGSITDTAEIVRIPFGTCATRTRALRRCLRKWGLR